MKNNQSKKADLIAGFALLGLGLFIWVASGSLGAGARLFPCLIGLVLSVVSLVLVYQTGIFKTSRPAASGTEGTNPVDLSFILVFFLALAYLLIFVRVGFEIASFFLMSAIMLRIEKKFIKSRIMIAVLATAILALIFVGGLQLRIPLLINRLAG